MSELPEFSQVIRSERSKRDLTQRELADRIGVTDSYVAHLEGGTKTPSVQIGMALANAFGFTAEQQEAFLQAVDDARIDRSRRKIRVRGRAVRGALRTRSGAEGPGMFRLVDLGTGQVVQEISDGGHEVRRLSLARDGRLLAAGDETGSVRTWDTDTGEVVLDLSGPPDPVRALALSSDDRMLAAGFEDGGIRVWSLPDGELLRSLEGESAIEALTFSSEGRWLMSGGDAGEITVWEMATGDVERVLEGHSGALVALAPTPDFSRAVSAARDDTIRVWDLETGRVDRVVRERGATVTALAVSPDGELFAAGRADGSVRLWRAADAEELRELTGHSRKVVALGFRPDGVGLSTISEDGEVRVWDIRTGAVRTRRSLGGGPLVALADSADVNLAVTYQATAPFAASGHEMDRAMLAGAIDSTSPDPRRLAQEMASDPDLLRAYRDLRTALRKPEMRETVLKTLRAFARSGED